MTTHLDTLRQVMDGGELACCPFCGSLDIDPEGVASMPIRLTPNNARD